MPSIEAYKPTASRLRALRILRAICSLASLRRRFLVSSLLVLANGLPRVMIMFDPRSHMGIRKAFGGLSGTRAILEVLGVVQKCCTSPFWHKNCL
jgi:hypothetical protein